MAGGIGGSSIAAEPARTYAPALAGGIGGSGLLAEKAGTTAGTPATTRTTRAVAPPPAAASGIGGACIIAEPAGTAVNAPASAATKGMASAIVFIRGDSGVTAAVATVAAGTG